MPFVSILPILLLSLASSFFVSATPTGCPPSCKSLSLHNPTLQVDDFQYHGSYTFSTPAHQIASGWVNFTIINDMAQTSTICYGSSTWLTHFFYGQVWYSCDDDNTKFRFNYPTGELELNTAWTCGTGDKVTAFNGTATKDISPTCEETFWENPDWTMGQIFSSRVNTCIAPLTTIVPDVNMV